MLALPSAPEHHRHGNTDIPRADATVVAYRPFRAGGHGEHATPPHPGWRLVLAVPARSRFHEHTGFRVREGRPAFPLHRERNHRREGRDACAVVSPLPGDHPRFPFGTGMDWTPNVPGVRDGGISVLDTRFQVPSFPIGGEFRVSVSSTAARIATRLAAEPAMWHHAHACAWPFHVPGDGKCWVPGWPVSRHEPASTQAACTPPFSYR
jgi:hypothetical protein